MKKMKQIRIFLCLCICGNKSKRLKGKKKKPFTHSYTTELKYLRVDKETSRY